MMIRNGRRIGHGGLDLGPARKPRAKVKKPAAKANAHQQQLKALCQVIDDERARIGRMVVPTAYDKVDAWEAVLRARDEVTQ